MGSIVFDFLANSFLFRDDDINDEYKDYTVSQLETELENYRKHCLDNYDLIVKEIIDNKSSLKVFSGLEKNEIPVLIQTALYLDQYIIYDPLFKFTETESEESKVTTKYLGFDNRTLNKKDLATTTRFLKQLTPMIVADYIKIIPASYHLEPPANFAINYPVDNYNSILPQNILKYFYENVDVKSMDRMTKGWYISDNLKPCRGIHIDFKGLNSRSGFVYHLFEVHVDEVDEEKGILKFHQTLPDTPPDIEYFKTWVTQSVNSASKAVFDKIYLENFITSKLNSTYLCDNTFTGNILTREFNAEQNIQTHTSTELINLNLPFLDKISIDKLMEIRKYEEDVFTNFRIELEKQFRELRLVTDSNELQIRRENIVHELNDVQVFKIQNKMKSINRNKFIDSVLMVGGLAGAVQTGGLSLLASALALGKGYKDFKDYTDNVKENPSYLLWKIQKK
jgi:hypothetical protein